jgi:Family of unknown function (DUF6174)
MRKRSLLIIAGALALTIAGLLLWRSMGNAGERLDAARALWAGRPFQSYQIALFHQTNLGICEQEIVAQDERQTQALRNTCGQPPSWTVTKLFNWINELQNTPTRCYPDQIMCACQIRTSTVVTYDPELGYPQRIVYEWRKQPNLTNLDYWRSLTDQSFPGCDKDGTGGPVIVNITLAETP